MNRSYYSASVADFLRETNKHILGALTACHPHELEFRQRDAWIEQIQLFTRLLQAEPGFRGHLFFEFSIPRMGKRADVVLLHRGIVFVLEFKVGERHYTKYASDQALDYGLDLKNFHSGSHDKTIVPIVVATQAPPGDGPGCDHSGRADHRRRLRPANGIAARDRGDDRGVKATGATD